MKIFILLLLSVSCASKKSEEPTLWTKYENVLLRTPAVKKIYECKELDLKSSKESWKHRSAIEQEMAVMIRPNFNGAYRMIEIPTSGKSLWLVADCRTGQFTGATLTGDLMFTIDSAAIIRHPPNVSDTEATYQVPAQGLPEIYHLDEKGQFILQENKVQRAK